MCHSDTLSASTVVAYKEPLTIVQTLSGEPLKNLSSSTVADALKFFSGVQIKDYGGLGGQKTVNVRSMGSQHVGVYLDGVRITNVQNGTVDLGKYSLQNMESIEVCNAHKVSPLMSASEFASGATVYLNTIRPKKSTSSILYQLSSFNTHKVSLNASYKTSILFDGEFCHSDGNYPFHLVSEYEDTVGVRRNSDITFFRTELSLFHKNWKIHAYHYNSVRGLPGGIVRRLSDKYTDVGREWDQNSFVQSTYLKTWDSWSFKFNSKYEYDYLHYRSDYPENISVHINNQYHQQDLYLSSVLMYKFDYGYISLSPDARWSGLDSDVKNFSHVDRLDTKVSLSSRLNLSSLSLSSNLLYSHINDFTVNSSEPLNKLTGGVHMSYTPQSNFSFRAFYKSIFRAPTLNDLYYTQVGNRNLRPELVNQVDIGVSYTNSWSSVQCDLYHNFVKDRIVCLPLKGTYHYTMLNYGKTESYGVNFSSKLFYRHHDLLFSLTYQDDRDITDPLSDTFKDFIPYSPKWSFTAVYTLTLTPFIVTVSHMFVSPRYWTVYNAYEPPLSSYNCTDMKLTFLYKFIQMSLELQDIFDVQYQLINRWPMPGRRYSLSLKIQF